MADSSLRVTAAAGPAGITVAPGRETATVAAIIAGATALRLGIALCSRGTEDVERWERFAWQVREHGVPWMYAHVPLWNHPPLMGYLAAGLHALAARCGWAFGPTFKLAPIAGDVLALLLLFSVWRRRTDDPRPARWAVVIFALSLDAILVSGYHGNTDPLAGAFALASCVAAERQRYVWAGLLIAAAFNVKLIPLLLLPLLVARATPREAARFAAGAALGVVPFVPVLWAAGHDFFAHAVAYRSNFDNWGIPLVIRTAAVAGRRWRLEPLTEAMRQTREAYVAMGAFVIGAAVLALAAFSRWRRPLPVCQAAAAGLAVFLVLTPGFGVQYTAIVGPVMLAAGLGWGLWWAALSGLFVASVYAAFWTGGWPPYSDFATALPRPAAAVGVAAWSLLVLFIVATLRGSSLLGGAQACSGRDHAAGKPGRSGGWW